MNFQMDIWVFQIFEKWMAVSHNVDNVTAGRSSRMLCTAESGENQLAWHPSANSLWTLRHSAGPPHAPLSHH